MENQHRKISGYRELSQFEIDLMNEIKAFGPQLQALCEKVDAHINSQFDMAYESAQEGQIEERNRLDAANPYNWQSKGVNSLAEGLMFLTRAVAQPTFF